MGLNDRPNLPSIAMDFYDTKADTVHYIQPQSRKTNGIAVLCSTSAREIGTP